MSATAPLAARLRPESRPQGQGPYSGQIKLLEKEIADEMKRVRELIGEGRDPRSLARAQ